MELTYGDSHQQLTKKAQGASVVHLHNSDIKELEILVPSSLAEQQELGNYFSALDVLLLKSSCRVEKLKQVKAACLQNMFPKKGHNIPNLRFKGFSETWEEVRIKDCATYHSSGVRVCDVVENGEYDLYDANGIIGKIDSVASTAEYISIIKDGAGVGRVRLLPANTNCLGTMGCISPKEGYDIRFLFNHLATKDFQLHIVTGTIPHVYFKNYGEDAILVPTLLEQQKIGEFFSTLDAKISLASARVEKLKQIKAACLRRMFP